MRKFFIFCVLGFVSVCTKAQNLDGDWYVGINEGFRTNKMSFSNIDKDYFPTNKSQSSGVFSFFVQGEFGKNRNLAVRPEITFLNRGGRLTEINNGMYDLYDIEDMNYTLKAHYTDLRVPIIYNFGEQTSSIRPYVYIAPVLGFVTGGNIKLQQEYTDYSYEGLGLDLSNANIASTYFAGQIGTGVKFAIPVADNRCYIGVEANYEIGFSDTYSKKEKNMEANDIANLFTKNYKINGTRKFSGFEIKVSLSVPFSIFKSKKEIVQYTPPPAIVEIPVQKEEKPCYTLDEIIMFVDNNESIDGKTICAVDDINFDFSKSTIKPNSYEYLDKLAMTLIKINKRVEVKGHTDNVGSNDFNMNLSKERAQAVVDYLLKKGVDRNNLTYSYYGKSKPLTSNDTEEGRAMNRRVEFTILNSF